MLLMMINLACDNVERNVISRYGKPRDLTALNRTCVTAPPIWLVLSEPLCEQLSYLSL